jgi:aldehyde dehydrogenase (NAD+)
VRPAGVACYLNSGQTCTALTRMLVPRTSTTRPSIALARAGPRSSRSATRREGDGRLGPLISEAQRDRVRGYIEQGHRGGRQLVTGGASPRGLDTGYFVQPTVFADVTTT